MSQCLLSLILVLPLVMVCTSSALPADLHGQVQRIPGTPVTIEQSDHAPDRDQCSLAKTIGVPGYYIDFFEGRNAVVTYFDPVAEGCSPAYPLDIGSFTFTLHDPGGYHWPASVAVVQFDLAVTGDPRDGPGLLKYYYSFHADSETFRFPDTATVELTQPWCVNEPFFIGLMYMTGDSGSTPSVVFEECPEPEPDTGEVWLYLNCGHWHDVAELFAWDCVSYPLFWIEAETESANCEDICEWYPGNPYSMQYPQMPDDEGWDVMSAGITLVADDWLCTRSGWLREIQFWGSWIGGVEQPPDEFCAVIYANVPEDQSPSGYATPGEILWAFWLYPGDYTILPVFTDSEEGWYDPVYDTFIEHDHDLYFRYTACLDSTDWFWQEEGTIYWLGINAVTGNTDWGVRSSVSHWNANAVWFENQEEQWYELYAPPDFTQPLSMSFVVNDGTTGEYVVELGDSDASGSIDIDDAVWLIAYVFSGGPTPMPYPTASGDANCDCAVDIDDIVYLIAYILAAGPPPCSGEEWISICGPPFR